MECRMNRLTIGTIKMLKESGCSDRIAIQGIRTFPYEKIYFGYIDLNKIEEHEIIHFACPIRYIVICEFEKGTAINLFDDVNDMKKFLKQEVENDNNPRLK